MSNACKHCEGRGMCSDPEYFSYYARVMVSCASCKGTGQEGGKGDVFDAFCLYAAGQTAEEIEDS